MGDYDELARHAEHGGLAVKPGTVRRGPEAAEAARTALMAATGREPNSYCGSHGFTSWRAL